jgi:hypothetical protein
VEAASSSITGSTAGGISYDVRRWTEAAAKLSRAIDYPLCRLAQITL